MHNPIMNMTPQQIVAELDKHVVGQARAKRAVAIALRNRWRRQQVAEPLRHELLVTEAAEHEASLPPGTQLLVSLEPRGGSPTGQPTGPVLYGGRLAAVN